MSKRKAFFFESRLIYEWEQSYDEVCVFIKTPRGARAAHLFVEISATRVKVGIKGNPPYLEHELNNKILLDESTWILQDGELEIILSKATSGNVWTSVFVEHETIDHLAQEQATVAFMRERLGNEHPQFDFSVAEFNEAVPDPRTFLK
jgi:hypothetical protein